MRLGAERQWVEDRGEARGPGLKTAQGSQSQMWAEWGQQVHVMAGWGRGRLIMVMGRRVPWAPWAGTGTAGVAQGAVSCHTGTGRF